MTTTTYNKTEGTVLLTTQLAGASATILGTLMDTSGKMNATVFVRYGRTAAGSLGATVFRIEGSPSGAGGDWVPIYTWTTALHGSASLVQTLNSNAAAGATSIQLSAALGSALSTPLCIYNSAAPANSEWNWQQNASTNPPLNWSLAGAQTAGVALATSYAEMWAIPVDLSAMTAVRLVVDNAWNNVATASVVNAQITTADSLNTA